MSQPEKSGPLDRLLFAAFIGAIAFAAFVGGAAVLNYKLPGSMTLTHAFEGGQAWFEQKDELEKPAPSEPNLDTVFAHPQVTWERDKASIGYTLMTTWSASAGYLVDMEGRVVHKWRLPFSRAFPDHPQVARPFADARIFWERAQIFPNGDLIASYITIGDTPYGYGMAKMDKHSKLLWIYDSNTHHDFYIDHHDGNIYTLTQSFISDPLPGLEKLPYPMLADAVAILSPEGREIKKIPLLEAFQGTPFELMLYHAGDWDQFHANSIEKLEPEMAAAFPMFKAGDILVSVRTMNALIVIDPDTGKVVWAREGAWKGQHAAHFLASGHILLFDNHGQVEQGESYSRALEVNPSTGGIEWSYVGGPAQPFFSKIIGRVQRLPNGNTLITEGMKSRVFEIDTAGHVVWNYVLPQIREGHSATSASQPVIVVSTMRYAPGEVPFLDSDN